MLCCVLCWLAWFAGSARALERVTLRNGFAYDCSRQEPVDGGRVRLFFSETPSGYIDLPSTEIASIEALPDPPPPPAPNGYEARTSSSGAVDVRSLLAKSGVQHNIDIELLASIVHAESSGRPHAVSRTGAQGLMQLMPGTAHEMGVSDAFQPADNIAGGTAYLDVLLDRYHDNLALALAAYNAGPAAVARYRGMPPFRETRAYVARVMTEFKRRKLAAEKTALASR